MGRVSPLTLSGAVLPFDVSGSAAGNRHMFCSPYHCAIELLGYYRGDGVCVQFVAVFSAVMFLFQAAVDRFVSFCVAVSFEPWWLLIDLYRFVSLFRLNLGGC